jgi:hypothetical protein
MESRAVADERTAATALPPTKFYAEVTPGSLVIERYRYEGPRGGRGVQWCVHIVEGDGALAQLYVADSRRAAAKWASENV